MRKFIFGGLVLAALTAAPAMAADLPVRGPQPIPTLTFSWTGWYVGGFVGGAWGAKAHTSDPCHAIFGCWLTTFGGEVVSYSMSPSFIGGVSAGYNYQIPGSAIVFGLETEFGYINLDGSSSFAGVSGSILAPNLVASATIGKWYNATTVRVGWTWDRLLFYGKGGFAVSTIESKISENAGLLGEGSGRQDILGWAWGAGLEYALSDRWSVKAEYLWLGLNQSVSVCPAVAAGPLTGLTLCGNTSTSSVQTAKVGVNYMLNAGPVYARY